MLQYQWRTPDPGENDDGHIISNDGTVISFRQGDAGRLLLLVQGMTADHNSWHRISPQLERRFTVYAVDQRGREGSGDSPDYHFNREVEDVVAMAEAIGEPVFFLGHSYGGLLSMEATLLTDRVSRLILYEADAPQALITAAIDEGIVLYEREG